MTKVTNSLLHFQFQIWQDAIEMKMDTLGNRRFFSEEVYCIFEGIGNKRLKAFVIDALKF